jgi:hypothetical protein
MRAPKGFPCHQCSPQEWRHTPNLTGSYELDAVIAKNPNPAIRDRLEYYLGCSGNAYGSETAYSRSPKNYGTDNAAPGTEDD